MDIIRKEDHIVGVIIGKPLYTTDYANNLDMVQIANMIVNGEGCWGNEWKDGKGWRIIGGRVW